MIEGRTIIHNDRRFTVERLSSQNVELLARFLKGLSETSRGFFDPHADDDATLSEYLARNETGVDTGFLLLTDERKEAAAYFFLWETDCEVPVLGIGIADSYQNEGLGKKLIKLLIEEATDLGKSGIDLTTMRDNNRAFHLYERCGFFYVGDVPNVTGDGRRVIERRMFYRIKPGTEPPERTFGPPDSVSG